MRVRSAGSWGCVRVWGCGVVERRVVGMFEGAGLLSAGSLGMYRAAGFVVLEGVFLGGGRVPGGLSLCSPDLLDKGVGFH